MSFKIIISLELLSEQIYQEINKQTIFFLFLIKLCEDKYIIEHVQKLLSNENLSDFYDADTAEHVVQYMYKWKVCSVKVYRKCQSYVQELLKLLPE